MRLRRRRHHHHSTALHSARPPRRGRFKTERRRHPWLRRTLVAVFALVLVVVLAGGSGWLYVRYRLDHLPRVAITSGLLTPASAGTAYDVLLVDTAGGSGPANLVAVARVVPGTPAVELLAIPASLRLSAGGHKTPAPLFGSLPPASAGGLSLLVHGVETELHIPVTHVAEIDTSGMQALIDHLGGVYLDFPAPLVDQSTGLRLDSTGCQRVSGAEALTLSVSTSPYWYQRGWQQWAGGSLTTVPVELAVLAGLLLRATPSLGNPVGVDDLVTAAAGAVHIDTTWSAGALMSDAGRLAGIAAGHVTAQLLPTAAAGSYRVTTPATAAAVTAFLANAPPAVTTSVPWLPTPCTP